jgi:hypothetical protein
VSDWPRAPEAAAGDELRPPLTSPLLFVARAVERIAQRLVVEMPLRAQIRVRRPRRSQQHHKHDGRAGVALPAVATRRTLRLTIAATGSAAGTSG